MKILMLTIYLTMLAALTGCISTNRLTTINFRQEITPFEDNNPFRHTLVHQDDSTTTLLFEVAMNKLKYQKNENSGKFSAHYHAAFRVYPDITSNNITDSSTLWYSDSLLFGTFRRKTHQLQMAIPQGQTTFVHIRFSDLNAGKQFNTFHEIEKSTSDPYNFLVKNETGAIHYPPYKRYYNRYRFTYRDDRSEPLTAAFFDISEAVIAPPPFAEEPHNDSSLHADSYTTLEDGVQNTTGKKGLFIIRKKDEERGGMRFLSKNEEYPAPENAEGYMAPLRYISTNKEYMALEMAVNKAVAVEQFWIKATGDYERAFERMASYEQRIRRANKYFTSYKEGWKTDRGMIYIVFGWPDRLLKYQQQEKWIYDNGASGEPVTFIFKNKMQQYPAKDYYLERREAYRIPWYEKVESWKN